MKILGILNITADSFSDGGKYLDPAAAIAHAQALVRDGADIIDIGAASSNPDAQPVPPQTEIARLAAVIPALTATGIGISVDSFQPAVQRWALEQGVRYLNDIHGFADAALYPALAASSTRLIVMHAVQQQGIATRDAVPPDGIFSRVTAFFDARIAALEAAGIARDRLILDPGMGFFSRHRPQCLVNHFAPPAGPRRTLSLAVTGIGVPQILPACAGGPYGGGHWARLAGYRIVRRRPGRRLYPHPCTRRIERCSQNHGGAHGNSDGRGNRR